MAKGKPPFAPVPARAMRPLTYVNKERQRDEELTALDLRVLMCICWHDRLSVSKGSAGCYASNALMAAEVGCTMQSLSRSISHLISAGLIERDRGGVPGKRHLTVYRVLYDPEDVRMLEGIVTQSGNRDLPNRVSDEAQSVIRDCGQHPKSVTRANSRNGRNPPLAELQETSLREGRDSSEDEGINSSKEARFAARGSARDNFDLPVGARLAMLERSLKAGEKVDCVATYAWLQTIEDEENCFWALRLCDLVIDAMDDDEYRAWGEDHGWVDEDGNWNTPHPRQGEAA